MTPHNKKQLVLRVQYLNKEKQEYEDEIAKLKRKLAMLEGSLTTLNSHWDQVRVRMGWCVLCVVLHLYGRGRAFAFLSCHFLCAP